VKRAEARAILAAMTACGKEKSCDGKRPYGTEIAARTAARSLNGKPEAKRHGQRAYPCPWCDRWHVGLLT